MIVDILKGFIIGICASAPMGPIAILVVQKTISKGRQAGFMAGLGASVVDTIFAIIAVFALTAAQKVLNDHENIIYIAGGLILGAIGISMTLSNPFKKQISDKENDKRNRGNFSSKDFMQAIAMGISNPGAILVIFALFSAFGVDVHSGSWDVQSTFNVAPIILSVSAGTVFYWFILSWGLSKFRDKFNLRTILWINRVLGALVIILAIVFIGQGLYNVVFLNKPLF